MTECKEVDEIRHEMEWIQNVHQGLKIAEPMGDDRPVDQDILTAGPLLAL